MTKVASVWDCKVCSDQMFGGPRCREHNPTPEEREAALKHKSCLSLRMDEQAREEFAF